jgi:hypothetical protein
MRRLVEQRLEITPVVGGRSALRDLVLPLGLPPVHLPNFNARPLDEQCEDEDTEED